MLLILNKGFGQKNGHNQISDSCEDSVTSAPIVGGTSMGMLDALACAARQADPVENIPNPMGYGPDE